MCLNPNSPDASRCQDIGGDAANTISGIFDDEIPHDDEEVVVPREREKKDKKKKKDKKDKKDKKTKKTRTPENEGLSVFCWLLHVATSHSFR